MLISVIVPVYNTERYLSACIDSILSQTYTDIELLLVDDGSTDGSGKICDDYAARDNRIRVFHKENGGVSSARNLGLDKAVGEWICFVDSDDFLPIDSLYSYNRAINDKTDLVIAKYKIYGIDSNSIIEYNKYTKDRVFTQIEFLEELYDSGKQKYQGYICSKLYRRSVIVKNSIRFNHDIFFNEDRLFTTQFVCVSSKPVVFKNVFTYHYYLRSSSAMNSIKIGYNRKFVTDFDALVLMKKEIDKLPFGRELRRFTTNGIFHSFAWNQNLMMKFKDYYLRNHWHMLLTLITSGTIMLYLRPTLSYFVRFHFHKLCSIYK